MDKTFWEFILNIVLLVPIIIILIIISLKLSRKSLEKLSLGSYIQVIEIVKLSSDMNLCVIKLGETGKVIAASSSSIEVIKDLDKYEINEIIKSKNDKYSSLNLERIQRLGLNKVLKNKFIGKKNNGYIKSDFK